MRVFNAAVNSFFDTDGNFAYKVKSDISGKEITRWVFLPKRCVQQKIYFPDSGGFDAFITRHKNWIDKGKIVITHTNHRRYKPETYKPEIKVKKEKK